MPSRIHHQSARTRISFWRKVYAFIVFFSNHESPYQHASEKNKIQYKRVLGYCHHRIAHLHLSGQRPTFGWNIVSRLRVKILCFGVKEVSAFTKVSFLIIALKGVRYLHNVAEIFKIQQYTATH